MTARMNQSLLRLNTILAAFSKKVQLDQVSLQKKVALQILTGVVTKTPVDTGRARGGWQVDIDGFNFQAIDSDKAGNSTINEGLQRLQNLQPNQVVRIGNNVVYITELEKGSSLQAPTGMVATTVDQVRAQFE